MGDAVGTVTLAARAAQQARGSCDISGARDLRVFSPHSFVGAENHLLWSLLTC